MISGKQFTETNFESLQKALVYIKNNLIDSDGNMYLIVEILIEINSIINIALRKLDVKPFGFDKGYVNNDLIELPFIKN